MPLARYFSTVSCAAGSLFTGGIVFGLSRVGTALFLQTAIVWRASDMRLVSIHMVNFREWGHAWGADGLTESVVVSVPSRNV
jgi:hypothetical protein